MKQTIDATCPECRGPLTKVRINGFHEYRCLVGHVYSARTILQAHSEAQETALWLAVVALEEAVPLVRATAGEFPAALAERLGEQAEKKREQAAAIRWILNELERFETE
ncbi:MAG TPA: hypothetical protein VGF59_21055 [Bryobacteraceae bacterium]